MGRTGTISLKLGLEILLGQPCYHSYEISEKHRDHIPVWRDIFEQLKQDPNSSVPAEKIRKLFKNYRATTDHPACALHRQLLDIYPQAKFILTLRDSRAWIKSIRETVMPHKPHFPPTFAGRLGERIVLGAGFMYSNTLSFNYALGWDVDITDDEQCTEAFDRRTEEIIRTIPPERLLIYRVADGWEPLCQFLNLPVPNTPFPHANSREDMQRMFDTMRRRRNMMLVIILLIVLVLIVLCITLPICLSTRS
ncbi:Nad dependent epimerase dehydratase [Fasciola hepatica]|uniref:Nad dependent epimerase dehydratase n=1 Tax=Fasciola hepatica TaxID=6192 RepID=A0A4E0R018_FASHE|nr:Nad dependent epimerase dehydratase [Fasciola hepatica]